MKQWEYMKLLHRALQYRYRSDKEEINFLLNDIKKGDTVFDVGAHKGGYTYWMKQACGHTGKVVAFEPQSTGTDLLQMVFGNTVRVEHLALSDQAGTHSLFIQPQSYDVSFEASLDDRYEPRIIETVTLTTLDMYCSQHQFHPSFIKIDAEGHEQQIIRGGEYILRNVKPTLLIESEIRHIGQEAMFHLFHQICSYGYRGHFYFNGKKRPLSDFNSHIHQNSSLIPKNKYANNFIFTSTGTIPA